MDIERMTKGKALGSCKEDIHLTDQSITTVPVYSKDKFEVNHGDLSFEKIMYTVRERFD